MIPSLRGDEPASVAADRPSAALAIAAAEIRAGEAAGKVTEKSHQAPEPLGTRAAARLLRRSAPRDDVRSSVCCWRSAAISRDIAGGAERVAVGLTDDDIDGLIKQAQKEVEPPAG